MFRSCDETLTIALPVVLWKACQSVLHSLHKVSARYAALPNVFCGPHSRPLASYAAETHFPVSIDRDFLLRLVSDVVPSLGYSYLARSAGSMRS